MEYRFRFKSKLRKNTKRERANRIMSKFLFWLYSSSIYKRFNIGQYILRSSQLFLRDETKSFDKYSELEVDSIVFSDILKIEDVSEFSRELVSILTPLKPAFLQTQTVKKSVYTSLSEFEDSYKTIKIGQIYRGINLNSKIDLIKGISVNYIKGEDSFFIIKYVVEPSDKFNQLLKELLNKPKKSNVEIQDVKLRYFFSDKNFTTGFKFSHKSPNDYIQSLFDELNFQLKDVFLKRLSFGIFKTDSKLLFPKIVTFKYDRTNFESYESYLLKTLINGVKRIYTKDDIRVVVEYPNLQRNPSNSIFLLFQERFEDELDNGRNSIGNQSSYYVDSMLPNWLMANIASKEQTKYVLFRKNIFKILRERRTSLFLKRSLKIKQDITLQLIDYKRLRNDFMSDRLSILGESKLLESMIRNCGEPTCTKTHTLLTEITELTNNSIDNLNNSFAELFDLLHEFTEIQNLRANMRLQKVLFRLTVIGTLIALYSSNSNFINSWIEYLLNIFGLTLPKPH